MPTNEEGEFELIMGNRQLLSVFFIVVILLAVFFAMGYLMGRSSAPLVTADATPVKSSSRPVVVEPPAPREAPPREVQPENPPPTERAPSTPIATAPQQPAEPAKTAKAEPVKAPPKPEPVKAEPAKSTKAEKAEKEKAEKAEKERARAAGAGPSGTYLQLAATTKREADIMVDVLRQKKFAATASEIPEKPGLFRVLVGPLAESQVNKTKTDLQSAGFPGDKSIKRSF